MRHYVDPMDFTTEELTALLDLADDIIKSPAKYAKSCEGKVLATLFYEPSTRTRLSFESAMQHLGGSTLGFASADTSSASKGESVADTIRVITSYADICAMRHKLEGAPKVASLFSGIPVINAGDGGHQHPTQTLTDLLTIRNLLGRLDNLTVGMCGDLKYGRTVHSLMGALSRYSNVRFVFISPEELEMPKHHIQDYLVEGTHSYETVRSLDDVMGELDVLYMTRIQRERFSDLDQYERLKDSYILDEEKMKLAKKDMIVLHPLPRVNEISVAVDDDPRAAYFDQVRFGRFVRMALILTLLKDADGARAPKPSQESYGLVCGNDRCITTVEQELPQRFVKLPDGSCKCFYCETAAK